MYAIVENGGKQYKVEKDLRLDIEYNAAEAGSKMDLNCIMFSDEGKVLTGSKAAKVAVKAEVLSHGKGEKIIVYKYKAKKNVRNKQGHRQPYTTIKVTDISVGK